MTVQRTVAIVGGVLAALLIAAGILLAVLISQNSAAAEQVDHDRIVAICQEGLADPFGDDMGEMTACIAELRD